jgi:hypothetical protein
MTKKLVPLCCLILAALLLIDDMRMHKAVGAAREKTLSATADCASGSAR